MKKPVIGLVGAIIVVGAIPVVIFLGVLMMMFVGETEEPEIGAGQVGDFCVPAGVLEHAADRVATYPIGPVQPHARIVAEHLGAMFGIRTIGGYREDAVDQGGHPAGLALDIMTNDIPNGDQIGDQMAAYLIAHVDELSVDYLIWQQRLWLPRVGAWSPMPDRGSISANHYDHIHLNVTPRPSAGFRIQGMDIPECENDGFDGQITAQGWTHPLPAATRLSSRFGQVRGGYTHAGDDLPAPIGTPIYAAADGVVVDSHCRFKNGRSPCQIRLDHGGGIETLYVHMYATGVHVTVGQNVNAGDHIADVGNNGRSSGPHLHLEVWRNGTAINPYSFFNERGIRLNDPAADLIVSVPDLG